MESWRSGSIHSDVPVYPRWPKERGPKYFPDCDGDEGVSHPRAREVPAGADSRRVKSLMVSGRRMGPVSGFLTLGGDFAGGSSRAGVPAPHNQAAKRARSSAIEKSPACPATPPRTKVFSSWTSP